MKRVEDSARSKAWNLAKDDTSSKKRQGCVLLSRGGMGTPSFVELEEREFAVDSGASMHLVSKKVC